MFNNTTLQNVTHKYSCNRVHSKRPPHFVIRTCSILLGEQYIQLLQTASVCKSQARPDADHEAGFGLG